MIRRGDRIKIKASRSLLAMQLGPLCNRTGVVTDVMPNNRTPGAMVKLDESYGDSKYWFVPSPSLVTDRDRGNDQKKKILNERVF